MSMRRSSKPPRSSPGKSRPAMSPTPSRRARRRWRRRSCGSTRPGRRGGRARWRRTRGTVGRARSAKRRCTPAWSPTPDAPENVALNAAIAAPEGTALLQAARHPYPAYGRSGGKQDHAGGAWERREAARHQAWRFARRHDARGRRQVQASRRAAWRLRNARPFVARYLAAAAHHRAGLPGYDRNAAPPGQRAGSPTETAGLGLTDVRGRHRGHEGDGHAAGSRRRRTRHPR